MILVVSGPVAEAIGKAIGVGDDLVTVWDYAKWPVLALVVMLVVALLYYATPNVKLTKFRLISVGRLRGHPDLAGWPRSASPSTSPTSPPTTRPTAPWPASIVALLWLWITNMALLFGAELDAELERGRELQIGIAAEESLQLPVRDTRGIEKAAARRTKDLDVQRDIRLAAAAGDPVTALRRLTDRSRDRPLSRPGRPFGRRRRPAGRCGPSSSRARRAGLRVPRLPAAGHLA